MAAERDGPIVVVNPGSSTLKLSIVEGQDVVRRETTAAEASGDAAAVAAFLGGAPEAVAAGVRVVHGGTRFRESTTVTDDVLAALEPLDELAPLHNPRVRGALAAVRSADPGLPVVACFDTAFHATLPDAAATYAVPWSWTSDLGVRRYGFHGLSHAHLARAAAAMVRRPLDDLRIVTCHLGAGASLAAVAGGRSVDTTMGFTPDEGLVMATRSGSVDPGALLWVQERLALAPAAVRSELEHESGVLGLSGVSADMREVQAAADGGHGRAQLALDVYVHRLRAGIAAMAAAMNGLDVLVFSGGVGENAPVIRARACDGLSFLGVAVDGAANAGAVGADADVTGAGSAVGVLVIVAREDVEIAAEVRRVLGH